ncbi:putative HTH-type transcriptional regulator YdzF [Paenibacillus chitinolyticus]|uniref:winged helix-turn-helix transcriptional regulator n=1 Tax=Paenibacillus chitinolyticus TaxID=79263 RepID=UPI0026E4C099|nr:helix-turn-helix domain-containing protein [Paenibacillus chitinolyticus]GKS12429.1 putative HTH-type transcriptional regulator YdzF [Paenibacillus chitinolyticus]
MMKQTESTKKQNSLTPFDYTLTMIGGKWKMKIMYQLTRQEVIRYGELKRHIPDITHKVLISQLKELEESNIVNRKDYLQTPPKVEYSLTPRGRTLMPILEAMCKWGMHNLPSHLSIEPAENSSYGTRQ